MTVEEYMQTDYRAADATLADFVQTVSLQWVDYKKDLDTDLPPDIITEIQIFDTAGNELSDLLPFDKEHAAENEIDFAAWNPLFERKIADIQPGSSFDCDYKIILE